MQREPSNIFGQVFNAFEPWAKLNNAIINNMQNTIQFQLEALQRYNHLGAEHLKATNGSQDMSDVQHYGERLGSWLDQMMNDFRTMADLGMEFRDELSEAFSEVGSQISHQVEDISHQIDEASQRAVTFVQDFEHEEVDTAKARTSKTTSKSGAQQEPSRQAKGRT
ncbi:phasin family protein [Halomonas sp. HP20-15]|uniref:phasin family protein n=1 Tax=Halomonas sp. HP20-15 TaxID=3085901 RepID=UPI00298278B6|nr:phasin family protein [Halomonas sp. HP20-15]MDW5377913.1 phasin family protein [Halomonas sp. HP20-15]